MKLKKNVTTLVPAKKIPWLESSEVKVYQGNHELNQDPCPLIKSYTQDKLWVWPEQTLYFFSDLHGDRKAFLNSLLATKEVQFKKGKFKLSSKAKQSVFLIGGDLFDKGPSNLELLDLLKDFIDSGAQVEIIAGNHDIRTFVGIHYLGHKTLKTSHLFTRMGGKSLTLFKEVFDRYEDELPACPHTHEELLELMFPDEEWLKQFPEFAKGIIHPDKLQKETKRIREKIAEIQVMTEGLGLTMQELWSSIQKSREIFLQPGGDYHWVFEKLELARIYGSFIFVHGGLDDTILEDIFSRDPEDLRNWFHDQLKEDAFDVYHGAIGNCFRTKYRNYDLPLTSKGVKKLHERGIFAIVHGHLNQKYGQRLIYREDMLHFQCDCSLDQNTRAKEDIPHQGAAVTIFKPKGVCEAISSDSDHVKVFSTADIKKGKKLPKEDIKHHPIDTDKLSKEVLKEKIVSKQKKLKFEHESIEDQESVIKYFETIVEGLKSGNIKFGNAKKTVEVSPNGLLKLKINVNRNAKKVKMAMNLEWKEKSSSEESSGELSIETNEGK